MLNFGNGLSHFWHGGHSQAGDPHQGKATLASHTGPKGTWEPDLGTCQDPHSALLGQ